MNQRFSKDPKEFFANNLAAVLQKIHQACDDSGRNKNDVRLLPISKTVPSDILRFAYEASIEAGIKNFGENKIQEAKQKNDDLADLQIKWSMVGHLQSNKIKYLVKFVDEFQALDSLNLAEKLNKKLDRKLDVYIQVNTSGEPSKYGLVPNEAHEFAKHLIEYENLNVKGFMTLAIFSDDKAKVNLCFEKLRKLRDEIAVEFPNMCELSMGMSGDYELAIKQGSNIVRVGQGIFGARPTSDKHYWPTKK